ncbi:aldo/keto reductase [Crocosphaera sp. XPORK-15E]|uniref:aldo/keto reductase n=1 Tax=Crocosphaera sp. XPORK-15E TaxID=3110247 RepID=UPI002B2095F3|nr:aldo/keto reductase [Crocosphaera sp. XPORK-15E]MEA5537336.1 aldo/keto reductase [Crocosphaera sp. XPORK-15E]
MQTVTFAGQLTTPALGIGTWAWGDALFWSYGKDYGQLEVEAAFKTAIEQGVTFFDTAEVYGFGKSEKLIGQFLASNSTQKPVQIATKFFPLPWRWNQQSVKDALTASLERLQVKQIALYQVHWPFDFFLGQQALMEALAQEVHQGRILTVGVSNYSAEQMTQAHHLLKEQGVPLAVNQVRYSLLSRQIESNGVLETAKQLGITILAYSPLEQGLLTGKYQVNSATRPEGARKLDSRFSRQGLEKIVPLLLQLEHLSQKYQKTPAQIALNWLISQGGVMPIPGAKTAEQARQNAGVLGWQLSQEDFTELAQIK